MEREARVGRSLALHACVVALLAAVCSLAMPRGAPDTTRYLAEAKSLAETNTFSLGEEVPTCRDAPGLPFVLSLFMRLGFEKPETPARLLNALCAGVIGFCGGLAVFWLMGTRSGGWRFVPVVAVYYCGLFPTILGSCSFVLTEVLYAALFLVGNIVVLGALRNSTSPKWLWLLSAGVVWGGATLVRPVPYVYPLLALPALVMLSWTPGDALPALLRRGGKVALASLAGFLVVTVPWTTRNFFQFHAFVPVCFGTGTYMYIGSSEEWNAEWPEFDPAERLMIESPGMTRLEADRELGRRAKMKIVRDPVTWGTLSALKVRRFLFEVAGSKKQIGSQFVVWALTLANVFNLLFAVIGGVALWRRTMWRELLWLLLPVIYTGALHMALYSMGRFRVPVEPYVCVLAVVGAFSLAQCCRVGDAKRGVGERA